MVLQTIISGGQTGVDRAALDACIEQGFPCGGWCPSGRKAEDGTISEEYPLTEIINGNYDDRTRKNIIDSDATLIIYQGTLTGGTLLTFNYGTEMGKPLFLFKAESFFIEEQLKQLLTFLKSNNIKTLNVAGPRASQWKEAYQTTYLICTKLIKSLS